MIMKKWTKTTTKETSAGRTTSTEEKTRKPPPPGYIAVIFLGVAVLMVLVWLLMNL